jgi:Rieske Fe-S protein
VDRWTLLLRAELSRRRLLQGGALIPVALAGPGCGASNPSVPGLPEGEAATTGGSGPGTSLASSSGSGVSSTAASSNSGVVGGTFGTLGNASSGTGASASSGTGVASSSGSGVASSSSGSSGGCTPACTQDANTLVVSQAQIPVGGGLFFTDARYRDPHCSGSTFVVLQPSAGQFVALSAGCTHACCTVRFPVMPMGFLICRCHGSRFDFQGQVLQGPATLPLSPLPVCADACNVYVQLA